MKIFMQIFTFSASQLRQLLELNSFPYSRTEKLIFGLRGCLATAANPASFKTEHKIQATEVNYENPRCLIGIFNPLTEKMALYPGSTVPHLKYMKKQQAGTGRANAMQSGFYAYYEKGFHNPSINGAHQALRLATNIVLRRTTNDLVFANDDAIEIGNPNDNIHAAYGESLSGGYSSAGCQVILGLPNSKGRNFAPNTSYWKLFHDAVYKDSPAQNRFCYALFRGADAQFIAQNPEAIQIRLRFGSKGPHVIQLQKRLQELGLFQTNIDGDFGRNTLLAVLAFQKLHFPAKDIDGVVGKQTALKLNLNLPTL
ncbi:peptidoglycan-binding domain-containing protein [Flavobacterium aurantiibacter]|uniref:Peptidoglycan binding-like domain-containing protein n=1 Tax=Flavobacterium aurantiibacter TaxID=2023067 RepID=A0A255ZXF5_9FLAO|nr:peptidoglycan-binding domain-containing protein [Flavobacterium aurantiibacter]OYQ45574.1 hypothetical protein CHX27_05795 [Flavobacterium aurantiibacter]